MDEEIVKCGWLTKKGAYQIGGWKRRWFVLREGPGGAVLAYYRKQADGTPAGEIALDATTLAYHHVDADRDAVLCLKTKGRTYEMLAADRTEMMGWIEALMAAALGLGGARKSRANVSGSLAAAKGWIKFHALGMQCECCWERLPEHLKQLPGVETVRIDAGADTVAIRVSSAAEASDKLAERAAAIMQERFGFLVTVL